MYRVKLGSDKLDLTNLGFQIKICKKSNLDLSNLNLYGVKLR